MSRFDISFDRVIGHEGGFGNIRSDRGNWTSGIIGVGELKGTKWGIAAHAYPTLDIRNLTRADAKAIYKRDYWDKVRGDELPIGLDFQVFDTAVNHGIKKAVELLQRTMSVTVDGKFGPKTLEATRINFHFQHTIDFLRHRLDYYNDLSTFNTFGRGWTQRIVENMGYAFKDHGL